MFGVEEDIFTPNICRITMLWILTMQAVVSRPAMRKLAMMFLSEHGRYFSIQLASTGTKSVNQASN